MRDDDHRPEVIPRRACEADRAALERLLADADIGHAIFDGACTATELRRFVDDVLAAAAKGQAVVAARPDAHELVGYAAVVEGWLSYGVRPGERRLGHATRLVRSCCAACDDPVATTVRRDNAASARLLERLGFHFAGSARERMGASSILRYVLPLASVSCWTNC